MSPASSSDPEGSDLRLLDLRVLVRRCTCGDQLAMLALVERFRGQVFGLCYRMLGQRQDAEDAAQETFVRVLKNLHRWDSARDFEPWLLAIAGNRCRTALSSRKRRPMGEAMLELVADDTPDHQAGRDLGEEVQRALVDVRDEYRQAFVLFHQEELSYAEIATAMEVPLGTIKTWVHRARKELIEELRRRGVVSSPPENLSPQSDAESHANAESQAQSPTECSRHEVPRV